MGTGQSSVLSRLWVVGAAVLAVRRWYHRGPDRRHSRQSSRRRPRLAVSVADVLQRLFLAFDRIRIREHLRRTERSLRDTPRPHLTPAQHRRRERHLDRLREYWRAGEFPTNREHPGRVPCFVGANGVPCAVAYLLRADGHDDLVERVARTANTVRIESLEDGPVVEWLDRNGFTRAEAARIQPTYPSGVNFATNCWPVGCWVAGAVVSVVGAAVFAATEYVGYRVAADLFPTNVLKRRGALAYFTVMNCFLAPLTALLLYALFP